MTTEARADQLVVGCLAAAAAIGAGNAIATGTPPPARQLVGFTFTGLALATGAMFAPGLAGGLAVLVLTSTALIYGGPLYDAVTTVTASPLDSPAPSSTTRKVNA